ncbi:MAG TPA: helix-turn-helix domain-containing protein [Blastocatellia bacterium]|nr:helix-turn-helix domain-containing protein [Blastocatellia bacterium]
MMNERTETKIRPKLWTPEDLAGFLGVGKKWVYNRTRRNGPERIPHKKMGKLLRFDPDSTEFKKWLESHSRN